LGLKEKVMEMMSQEHPEVKFNALIAVQKIMINAQM
jgi:hypothetical protein